MRDPKGVLDALTSDPEISRSMRTPFPSSLAALASILAAAAALTTSAPAAAQPDPAAQSIPPPPPPGTLTVAGSPEPPGSPAPAAAVEAPGAPVAYGGGAGSLAIPEPPLPPPDPEERDMFIGDHFELTMGFLAGQRDYTGSTFEFDEGNATSVGGGQIVEPFAGAPFDKVTVFGLRYDMRLVVSYIRMLAGFDFPFPSFRSRDTTGTYILNGEKRQVTVQSLSAKELRFGIGAEYQYKSFAPFIDVIGGVHWVDTEFAVDGLKASYGASNFAFSVRGGARLHVRPWFFVAASGELGLVGDILWNGELSVGFSIR